MSIPTTSESIVIPQHLPTEEPVQSTDEKLSILSNNKKKRRTAIVETVQTNAVYRRHAPIADEYKSQFNVLCLDGGGMKGVSECAMIEAIEEYTGRQAHELFDLVCGTSTGGILTCAVCKEFSLDILTQQ
jgi:predicted acylesterase/phospholipase RssA